MALNEFPPRSQTAEQWLGFYEAERASGEQDWMRDAFAEDPFDPQGWLSAAPVVNNRYCVWSHGQWRAIVGANYRAITQQPNIHLAQQL